MTDTKSRILDSALRLLQSRSYEGFSFQDVADEVGIRKASIYSHFRSKEALATAVLDEARSFFERAMADDADADAKARLDRYLGLFRRVFAGGERMCPGGSFAAVWSSVTPELQRAVRGFADYHLAVLESIVRQGRTEGAFATGETSAALEAALLLSRIQGAMLVARITGNGRVFEAAIERIRAELGT